MLSSFPGGGKHRGNREIGKETQRNKATKSRGPGVAKKHKKHVVLLFGLFGFRGDVKNTKKQGWMMYVDVHSLKPT